MCVIIMELILNSMHFQLICLNTDELLKVPPGFKVGVDFGQEGSIPVDILKAGDEGEQYICVCQ